jgi:hypothetical protein
MESRFESINGHKYLCIFIYIYTYLPAASVRSGPRNKKVLRRSSFEEVAKHILRSICVLGYPFVGGFEFKAVALNSLPLALN